MAHKDFFAVTDPPVDHTRAAARNIRGEFDRVQSGFSRLPRQQDISGGRETWGDEDTDHQVGAHHYKVTTLYPPVFAAGETQAFGPGYRLQFIAKKTSSAIDPTITVDGVGPITIKEVNGSTLPIGGIAANWIIELVFDGEYFRSENTANRQTNFLLISELIGNKAFTQDQEIVNFVLPEGQGGTSPTTYQVTGLPVGLAFDTATRVVSGTPTAIGTSTVTYTVTDDAGIVATQQFRISIFDQVVLALPDPNDLVFIANVLVAGFVLPEASGGTTPYIYTATPLPPGLSFDPDTRLVSGTPDTAGVYDVTYRVEDSAGTPLTATQTFRITINAAAILSLPNISNKDYAYNSPIAATTLPEASGGIGPYAYAAANVTPGLSFDADTREITGSPTTVGQRTVTYTVTDNSGNSVSKTFTINVTSQLQAYTAVVTSRVLDAGTVLDTSSSFAADATSMALPAWVGQRYIVILVAASLGNLNLLNLGGFPSLTAFERMDDAVILNTNGFDAYVSVSLQGDAFSEYPVTIGRPA